MAPSDVAPRKLVLWDLDGTLLHPAGFGLHVMGSAFLRLFGVDAPTGISFAGRTDRAILRDLIAAAVPAHAHRQDELHRLAADVAEDSRALFRSGGGRALPGALESIAALARNPDVVQSVLTGNLERIGRLKLAEIQADDHLDLEVAAFGDDHAIRADLVVVARELAEKKYNAQFTGRAIVLIGDTPLDIAAAAAHDALAIAVATGRYSPAELSDAGAHLVLPDLLHTDALLAAIES
ncbi:HAD family hydrolase [Nocardia jejuensis]|uniref:HAD family hydrolase n=1 Tax=Nocardia jejuensis TaxID=328049 RepID=UPI00082B483D|nr:haloacid dehalogenase-like hydrolase [Nocardia jejuensis]